MQMWIVLHQSPCGGAYMHFFRVGDRGCSCKTVDRNSSDKIWTHCYVMKSDWIDTVLQTYSGCMKNIIYGSYSIWGGEIYCISPVVPKTRKVLVANDYLDFLDFYARKQFDLQCEISNYNLQDELFWRRELKVDIIEVWARKTTFVFSIFIELGTQCLFIWLFNSSIVNYKYEEIVWLAELGFLLQ